MAISQNVDHEKKQLEALLQQQLDHISKLQDEIILFIANLIESRDGTTGEHVKRTSYFVDFLIRQMKKANIYTDEITEETAELIKRAAPMHDIGKITIPDSILQKRGRLNRDEYLKMQSHPAAGGDLIRKNMKSIDPKFQEIAINMATYHHEHWDGTGYPARLHQEEIPLCARMLTVADVYDALVSKRSYKESLSVDEAIEIMKSERGKILEPALLDAFISDPRELKSLTYDVF